jgi:hypothetical protein
MYCKRRIPKCPCLDPGTDNPNWGINVEDHRIDALSVCNNAQPELFGRLYAGARGSNLCVSPYLLAPKTSFCVKREKQGEKASKDEPADRIP